MNAMHAPPLDAFRAITGSTCFLPFLMDSTDTTPHAAAGETAGATAARFDGAPEQFASAIAHWQKACGRKGLPWQDTRDPYRIWLSEIMLQQTQVTTVMGYYDRFLKRFPDVQALAAASQEEVMPYWAGLGYYARARNLHRCAQTVCAEWNGVFPPTVPEIATLPGIGRSTAAAIAAFAYGERSPIMDGNVKRVFTRCFGIEGQVTERAVENRLWTLADEMVSAAPETLDMTAYIQGLMDLGSQCCTRTKPNCQACPLQAACHARLHSRQHELPTPRARKAVPERECAMLVLNHQGRILLEQQRSPGIWGGLWSLPRYDDATALRADTELLGFVQDEPCRMAAFTHVFTHFRLRIEPWYLHSEAPLMVMSPGIRQAWVPIPQLGEMALPAPVRKLLDGLFPPCSLI